MTTENHPTATDHSSSVTPSNPVRRRGIRTTVIVVAVVVLVAVAAVLVVWSRMSDAGSVRGSFDVGGRSLYLECVGEGTPTIVMDAGSGGDHQAWEHVVPEVRGANQTCTYDRANIGASDQAPMPRSNADVVADLHRLLEAADIPSPYVLVGHSFGGISMRLYAATYPTAVAGVVLVDPTPATFLTDACAIVDATTCAAIRSDFEPERNEGLDVNLATEALATAGPVPAVPLIILAADEHGVGVTDPGVQQRFEEMWQQRQQELADSVAGRVQVVASGHNIQSLHPEAVVEAIRSVLTEVAGPGR